MTNTKHKQSQIEINEQFRYALLLVLSRRCVTATPATLIYKVVQSLESGARVVEIVSNSPITHVINNHMIREYDVRKDKVISMNGTDRVNIKPGLQVSIILKEDQRSGKTTEGIVKDILTKSPTHHHGIKVSLENGQVGRVKEIRI